MPTTFGSLDERFAIVARILGPGRLHDKVYTITVPRHDLSVMSELGDIPVAAGIESRLDFFLCPCGKTTVIGQICVLDFEANDVIDELRAAQIKVVSMGPLLLGERPRIMLIRFQGEGQGEALPKALRRALSWIGDERTKPKM